MAGDKNKTKKFDTKKAIGILCLYLVIWWILMTLVNSISGIKDTEILYYIIEFLRLAVPVFALLFGVPIVLIVGHNKNKKK